MRLLPLISERWTVLAPGNGPNDCPVLEFLKERQSNEKASVRGMRALFRRYACEGRAGLTTDQFHLANKEERIWEFVKGRIRIYCFEDSDGALVILTHGAIKKTQKTARENLKKAVSIRDAYEDAKRKGKVRIEER